MKIKELIHRLQRCNPDFDVVFSQIICIRDSNGILSKISVEDAQENDWILRQDKQIGSMYGDHNTTTICIFSSHDDSGNPTSVDTEKFELFELSELT